MATRRAGQQESGNESGARDWPPAPFLVNARGRMTIRAAATCAGISESRWRQVEAGVQKMRGGIEVPVHPKAETVVAMARAIGADPEEGLRLADHDPAHYQHLLADASQALPDEVRREWFASLSRDEREAVLAELSRLNVDLEVQARAAASA